MPLSPIRIPIGTVCAGVAAIAALFMSSAHALSIGEAQLQSRLGEPLHVTIPLSHLDTVAVEELVVGPASEAEYTANGVDSAGRSATLRFQLVSDAKGGVVVDLSTRQVYSEPMLELVLEVRWPQGRAVKQFTLLLDPPQR